jgi:hypothetical protein
MSRVRHGRLGDAEPEHGKLAMNPWSTPEKVLAGHPYDRTVDLTGDPGSPTSPATTLSMSPNR